MRRMRAADPGHSAPVPPLTVPPGADTVRLPFDVTSVTDARGFVTDAMTEAGATRQAIEDANIVVGELVMNAIRHGQPLGNGTIEVAWWWVADLLTFSVRDGGRVTHLDATMPPPTAFGGRGLAMVAMLSNHWAYDCTRGTRVVADIVAGCPEPHPS